jgi:hypothetical protein
MTKEEFTFWIEIIKASGVFLGFPTAVWGILKLFRKNKSTDLQLKALGDIAFSQNALIDKMTKQIEELQKQTSEFMYQSSLMKDFNELTREEIKIQTEALITDKDYKANFLKVQKLERKS